MRRASFTGTATGRPPTPTLTAPSGRASCPREVGVVTRRVEGRVSLEASQPIPLVTHQARWQLLRFECAIHLTGVESHGCN